MLWFEYIHHITVHFPIVLTMVMAAVGLYATFRADTPELQRVLRWGGWITLAATTLAAISGILTAPGLLGGGGEADLTHHRDLAITTWAVIILAAWTYDQGVRREHTDWRKFAVAMWCIAVFGIIGTGHWGGFGLHAESIPW
ncbi:MAG: hypothetical protein ACNA8W_16730 [Bradymonadaceae bacterium]